MPPYLTHIENWKALWPLLVMVLLLTSLFLLLARPKEGRLELFILLAAFSMLGMTAGYLTGFSRESAVGAVLPAVLSLFGGLAVYLVGKDVANKVAVGLSIFIFSISLVIGTSWGAVMRQTSEDFRVSLAYLKQRAQEEVELREFREALGLPPGVETHSTSGKDDQE